MKLSWMVLPAAALTLTACNSDSTPSGQVAATVDGTEITTTEVTAEMTGVSSTDPKQQKFIADMALDAIASRTIVEKEALNRGLDKTPEGVIALKRAYQLALLDLLKKDLAKNAPTITDQEAQRFVSENRAMFAGRTIAVVEQLAVDSITPDVVRAMQPITTLAGIRALLDSRNIPYRASVGTVDSVSMNNDLGRQISALPIGEVFIIPQNGGVRINATRSRESFPIGTDDAVDLAKTLLSEQRLNQTVNTALAKIVTDGRSTIKYSENFSAPQNPAAPQAAPANAQGQAPAKAAE